jgi:universal stress protein A
MLNVHRVLVPTDFGQPAEAALYYGAELARLFGARLHVLHVNDAGAGVREFSVELDDDHSRQLLAALVSDKRELKPVCECRVGAPADAILEYAAEHGIDLVVMGTHGRDGVARMLLGSVAETVVRKATCPVLIVHAPAREMAPVFREVLATGRPIESV